MRQPSPLNVILSGPSIEINGVEVSCTEIVAMSDPEAGV